jgi:hypothetical protein
VPALVDAWGCRPWMARSECEELQATSSSALVPETSTRPNRRSNGGKSPMPACSRRSRWRRAATRAGDRDANRSTSSCQTDADRHLQKTTHPNASSMTSASPGGSSSPRVAAATLAARPLRAPRRLHRKACLHAEAVADRPLCMGSSRFGLRVDCAHLWSPHDHQCTQSNPAPRYSSKGPAQARLSRFKLL